VVRLGAIGHMAYFRSAAVRSAQKQPYSRALPEGIMEQLVEVR